MYISPVSSVYRNTCCILYIIHYIIFHSNKLHTRCIYSIYVFNWNARWMHELTFIITFWDLYNFHDKNWLPPYYMTFLQNHIYELTCDRCNIIDFFFTMDVFKNSLNFCTMSSQQIVRKNHSILCIYIFLYFYICIIFVFYFSKIWCPCLTTYIILLYL